MIIPQNTLPWPRRVALVSAAIIAASLLLMTFLPYEGLKALLGAPLPDRDFNSLHEGNALAFRGLFLLGGIFWAWMAYLLTRRNPEPRAWLADRQQDLHGLGSALESSFAEKYLVGGLIVLMVLALLARLPRLWAPLDHDQAYTAIVLAPHLRSALTDYHVPNNHVLHTIMVHFAISAFGLKPWAIRLPTLIAGLLIIPATYGLGRAIYDKYTGLMAAILVAALPAQINYTTSARGYALLALLTLLLFLLGDFVRKDKNGLAWFLIAIVSALGFWTIPIMLLPFGMLFTWLLLENWTAGGGPYGSRWNFIKYWLLTGFLAVAFTYILYAPLLIFTGFWKVVTNPYHFPLNQLVEMARQHLSVYREWRAGIPTWLAALLATGLLLSLIFHRRLSRHRFPLQVAGIVWFAVVVLLLRPLPWARIWFFLLAPVLIWCSAGTAGLLKDLRIQPLRNVSASAILIGFLAILPFRATMNGLAALPHAVTKVGREEKAVLFIGDQLRDGDLILTSAPQDAPIWYYSRVHGIKDEHFDPEYPHQRAFLVTLPVKEQRVRDLADQYDLTENDWGPPQLIQNFQGLQIFLMENR